MFIYIPVAGIGLEQHERDKVVDWGMVYLFTKHRKRVFNTFMKTSLLSGKQAIVRDIEEAYKRELWSACIVSVMPLLDFIMRRYFGTTRLDDNIQVLRNAFVEHAGLRSKDLMPGSIAVGEGRLNPNTGNTFAKMIEEDLRLPGIYLASFLEFADRYYCWYKSSDIPPNTSLNRHAVMHCASEYWTKANAVRILSFLHLIIYLEVPLKILILGEAALPQITHLQSRFSDSVDLNI